MHRTEIESLRLDKLQRQRILRRLEKDLSETRARVARKREDAQVRPPLPLPLPLPACRLPHTRLALPSPPS